MGLRSFLTGVGVGVGLAAALAANARRRTTMRESGLRLVDAIGDLPERAAGLGRRVRDEARDFAYEAWNRLQDGPVPDEVLAARVRAEVARVAQRPGYLTVLADRGNVVLTGWASTEEFDRLIDVVKDVKGVERVSAQLDAFGSPGPEAGPRILEERDTEDREAQNLGGWEAVGESPG